MTAAAQTNASAFRGMKLTSSPGKSVGEKQLAMTFKTKSETGNVPFSSAHRSGLEDAHSRANNTTVNAQTFAWKIPTVMQ